MDTTPASQAFEDNVRAALEQDNDLASAILLLESKQVEINTLKKKVEVQQDRVIAGVKRSHGITELTAFECALAESRAGVH